MKIAICLFVFCAVLLLADFVESKIKDDTNVNAILNNINKITMLKKKKATKFAKAAKAKMFKSANGGQKDISKLIKSSAIPYADLKKKALEAQNITIASSEQILDLVNKTVDGLRASLREACTTVKELKKVYFDQVTRYGNKCLLKINNAIKKNKMDDAKKIFKLELRLISKISESSTHRLTDVVATSSKLVSDLAESGRVLMLDTAEKQVKKLEPLYSNNSRLEQFIDFASEKIYSLAEQSGDKYVELVNDALKRLKVLVSSCENALKHFTDVEIQKGNASIFKQETYIANQEAEKKLDKEFVELMLTINKNSQKILTDALTTVIAIKGCKSNKENCKPTTTEAEVTATEEPKAEAPEDEKHVDSAELHEEPTTEKPATEEPSSKGPISKEASSEEHESVPGNKEPIPKETSSEEHESVPGNKEPISKETSSEEHEYPVPVNNEPISKETSSEENKANSETT